MREYVKEHSKDPYLFGAIYEVTVQSKKPIRKNKARLAGKVTFINDNLGRQMIESFTPLTEDDW